MYFQDLELCRYHPGSLDAAAWAVPLRAVGWLEYPHGFEIGAVPPGVLSKLSTLLDETHRHFPQLRFRGCYECSLCQAFGRATGGPGWSQDNLIIPGTGEVYASPGAIVHYVADHFYRPPAAFIDAVVSCPTSGSEGYFEALRRANAGREPPLC